MSSLTFIGPPEFYPLEGTTLQPSLAWRPSDIQEPAEAATHFPNTDGAFFKAHSDEPSSIGGEGDG